MNSSQYFRILAFIFISCAILLFPQEKIYCADDPYKNSCGTITFQFDPIKIKLYNEKKQAIGFSTLSHRTSNGFLVEHDGEIYFITVAIPARVVKDGALLPYENNLFYEILEERRSPTQIAITLSTREDIPLTLNKANSVSGNRVKQRRRVGEQEEKIDLLCINLTPNISTLPGPILAYDQLAGESDKPTLEGDQQITICGYPSARITQGYRQDPATITSPGTFATLSTFNNLPISGFSFALKLDESDAGRPVRAVINNRDMVIGIVKEKLFSGNEEHAGGVAIDSTAIKRTIDTLHRKASQSTSEEKSILDTENI